MDSSKRGFSLPSCLVSNSSSKHKTYIDHDNNSVLGMVSALDESVRHIVTTLKKKGLYDNSIIIFTTDNGGAAGGLDDSAGSNYPLRGAKNTLWEGGVRGVGFVHSPLLKKRGETYCTHFFRFRLL